MLGSGSLAGEGPNGARLQPCQLPATCLPPRVPPAEPPAVRMSGRARLARTLTWGLLPGSLAQLVWCEGVGRPLSLRLATWMASPLLESVLWVSESVTSGTGLALSGHSVQEGPGVCPLQGVPRVVDRCLCELLRSCGPCYGNQAGLGDPGASTIEEPSHPWSGGGRGVRAFAAPGEDCSPGAVGLGGSGS